MYNRYPITNQCYFDNLEFHIRYELHSAKNSIQICVAWINLSRYQDILIHKIQSGIRVEILCNDDFINHRQLTKVPDELFSCLTLISNPIKAKIMHHKFCIVDDQILISGSYNWSKSAKLHYENIIIIKNDFMLINKFKHEFSDLKYMALLSPEEFRSIVVKANLSTFNLGTISSQHGKYGTSTLSIWSINLMFKTYSRLEEIDVPNFLTSISYDNDIDDYPDIKDFYQEDFRLQRNYIESVQNYFKYFSNQVHAIGSAVILNNNEVLEYNEVEERALKLFWIDMRLTKVIPRIIDAEDNLETIWLESYYAGT